jgi:hypothetical protein
VCGLPEGRKIYLFDFAGIRYYRGRKIMTGRDFLPGPDGSLLGVPLAPELSGG